MAIRDHVFEDREIDQLQFVGCHASVEKYTDNSNVWPPWARPVFLQLVHDSILALAALAASSPSDHSSASTLRTPIDHWSDVREGLMAAPVPTQLFAALERVEPLLVEALQAVGVNRIEYVVGFVCPYRISVWMGTTTDARRDRLLTSGPHLELVRGILDLAGLPAGDVGEADTTSRSQETVDRDYEGSWFYALR